MMVYLDRISVEVAAVAGHIACAGLRETGCFDRGKSARELEICASTIFLGSLCLSLNP